LYDYYKNNNNYRLALLYFTTFKNIEDSIIAEENSRKVMEIQMNYEISRKDQQIQSIENKMLVLEQEKEIQALELNRKQSMIYFFLFASFLLLIIGILFFQQYRLKRRNSIILQEKIAVSEESNRKLLKSEQEFRKLNATKDKFFSIIAHDMKNSLLGIISISRIFSRDFNKLQEKELREFSTMIYTGSRQLFSLLENLLQWARSQTGSLKFRPVDFTLNDVVNKNLHLLKTNAEEKGLEIILKIDENIKVYADPDMVTLILRNLISNAIKFTRQGNITVSALTSDEIVEVSITDTGVGMNSEDRQRLFRIDQHFSTRGTAQEEGTGLGLILCQEFVLKNNGKIWAESEPGKGTSFKFTLPLAKDE
jgi:signal transduction histidine kinase